MNAPQPPDPWDSQPQWDSQSQRDSQPPKDPPPPQTPAWVWVLLGAGVAAIVVVVGLVWVRPMLFDAETNQSARSSTQLNTTASTTTTPTTESSPTTTSAAARTTTSAPSSGTAVPANATRCGPVFSNNELPNSATGSKATSCEFAEEVRYQYVSQGKRNATVSINAVSPVTNTRYSMSCTGKKVVTCTGGNNAIVYLF
ncbi:serine/threonine protein kinase [Rhodococcus sp. MS16]|uniref:serine/threonine protein kinase n=1 Tax=Rhodococcus sp. MS16 TaxID=2579941 RepID=UPI00191DA358|nr:serine/threonine protein kinase [Rhodococcus sp. MS16]